MTTGKKERATSGEFFPGLVAVFIVSIRPCGQHKYIMSAKKNTKYSTSSRRVVVVYVSSPVISMGLGKERRTLIGPWVTLQNGSTCYWNYLEGY